MRSVPRLLPLAVAALLTGCATTPLVPPDATEVITYEVGPGFMCGRCDSRKFAAASDGRVGIEDGHWAGRYSNWRTLRRTVRVTPEQYARFRSLLSPFRPDGARTIDDASDGGCVTDQEIHYLTWRGGGPYGRLVFDYGCASAHPDLVEALRAAVEALDLPPPPHA